MRYIDQIEPAGTEEAVCIQVAAVDSLYVTEDFLLTHNSLNSAFIILDEAQNTTAEQMKMFLTRLGFGSKMVVPETSPRSICRATPDPACGRWSTSWTTSTTSTSPS